MHNMGHKNTIYRRITGMYCIRNAMNMKLSILWQYVLKALHDPIKPPNRPVHSHQLSDSQLSEIVIRNLFNLKRTNMSMIKATQFRIFTNLEYLPI